MTRISTLVFAVGALAMLGACASGGGIAPGQEFGLDPGQQARLPDASVLHYVGIANDSRCPPTVACIRAGDADVLFDVGAEGAPSRRVIFNTERNPVADLGRWRLRLTALAAGGRPRASLRLEEP